MSSKDLKAVETELARLLRAEREKKGLSLNAVAERAGLSYQMVSYVERGLRAPSVETLLRIAWAMDTDPLLVLRGALKTVVKPT